MASTYSSNLRLELMATGANAATWGTNTNDNLKTIDAFVNGYLSKSVAGSSNVSISLSSPEGQSTDDAANKVIELTGALTGNIYVFLPETESNYLIYNNTSGSYTVTMAVETHEANGEAVITQSAWHWVYCEGSSTYAVKEAELGTNASTISTGTLDDARLSSNVALITGATFTGNLNLNDSVKATFGTGNDLEIYHNGSHSFIDDVGTGNLYIRSNNLFLRSSTNENFLEATENGAVQIYYDNSEKLATTTSGINVTGTVTDDGATHDGDVTFTGANYNVLWDKSQDRLEFGDNAKAIFGAGADLQIYHDASNSYITEGGTGGLRIDTSTLTVRNGAGTQNMIVANSGLDVELYHNNSKKLETTSSGILVTGGVDMTATQGEVGTYMFGSPQREPGDADVVFNTGGTLSGSLLRPATMAASYNNSNNAWSGITSVVTGNAQSGTWRCMGAGTSTGTGNNTTTYRPTLWFRIS